MRAERPWLAAESQRREAEIFGQLEGLPEAGVRDRIDTLIETNRHIHEVEALNLNPASNVMSPRAEAALGHGLGTRASLGHAGAKYEMGLEAVEEIEVIAADLVRKVFDADHAEIRPLSGAMSNLMTFMACAQPGDAVIVPPPSVGGHVTHNRAGAAGLYGLDIHEAPINPDTYSIDPQGVAELATRVKPKLITVGASLNLHPHPVSELREVADACGAVLMFDAAHASGMFAGKAWPNPIAEGAHVMSMSTYKSLAGPVGGLIVTNDAEIAERIDAIAYPGMTANFDVGRVAALAMTMIDWLETGREYCAEMVASAAALAAGLDDAGLHVHRTQKGPTLSHQLAVEHPSAGEAVHRLRAANLLTSEIGLPTGAGIRMGTPEAVRWGMKAPEMAIVAGFIAEALQGDPLAVAPRVTDFRRAFDTVGFCG